MKTSIAAIALIMAASTAYAGECKIVPIPDSNAFMRTGDCTSDAPTLGGHDPDKDGIDQSPTYKNTNG